MEVHVNDSRERAPRERTAEISERVRRGQRREGSPGRKPYACRTLEGGPALARSEVRRTCRPAACSRRSRARRTPPPRPRPCTSLRRRTTWARHRDSRSCSPSSRTRAPVAVTGRPRVVRSRPVRVVAERRELRRLADPLEPDAGVLAGRRIRRADERGDRESRRADAAAMRRIAPTPRRRAVVRRGRRRPRTVPPLCRPCPTEVSSTDHVMRRSVAVLVVVPRRCAPATRRAPPRARDDSRGVRRQERPLRDDAGRQRARSASCPGFRPRIRSRSTAGSSPRSTCRSAGRGWRSASRRSSSRSSPPCSSWRSATRLRSTGIGVVARAARDAAPVRHLARRAPEPRGARRASARASSCSSRFSPSRIAPSPRRPRPESPSGIAILGNARLALFRSSLAPYVAWQVRPGWYAPSRSARWSSLGAAVAVAPGSCATRSRSAASR